MRLFIAAPVPEKIKAEIGKTIEELKAKKSDIKWVKPENLHLTLKFLGEVKPETVTDIVAALKEIGKRFQPCLPAYGAQAGRPGFKISLEGLGNFNRRVFWIGGKEGQEELKKLAEEIENQLEKLGFKKESFDRAQDKEFSVHLTIGRAKTGRFEAMDEYKDKFFGRWQVNSFELVKSTLTPKGPIYKILERIPLGK